MLMNSSAQAQADPYQWLEEVTSPRALAFVEEANARTRALLEARPEYAAVRAETLEVLDAKERIPYVVARGRWLYNFWRDAANPRGLWRRTTLDDYRGAQPTWEIVLDLDALAKAEHENWVWHGAKCLAPTYEKCVIELSRGGGDAIVVREFDPIAKTFVEGGFVVPEAKTDFVWRDADSAYVGTDTGPGSLTTSGYARQVRLWKRGTPLATSPVVFEGEASDVSVHAWVDPTPGYAREGYMRALTFWESETLVLRDGKPVRIDVPRDALTDTHHEWLLVTLRSDWDVAGKTYRAGSLLATNFDAFLAGARTFDVLFEPSPRVALQSHTTTRDALLLDVLDNVRGRVIEVRRDGDRWVRRTVATPGDGPTGVSAFDPYTSNAYWLTYHDFLTPDTLFLADVGSNARETLKRLPAFFDTTGMRTEQHEAHSKDGTRIPYFVVGQRKAIESGRAPTLLYGYGGFEVPEVPFYSGAWGRAWLARGGVFVLANIRGGGEFGPGWHQAALKEHRQRAYDDFAAVAEDVEKRGLTTARHLAIQGGSNGGLLVGAVMLQRPELFRAVVCQVPLLDMKRYSHLLAGASWIGEYGDPDQPEDWAYLSKYSPYQNVRQDAKLPTVLFTTSTRDDRVHPGHARKMYARMREQGHDVYYFENTEGGHGGAADNAQRATLYAIEFSFLWQHLR